MRRHSIAVVLLLVAASLTIAAVPNASARAALTVTVHVDQPAGPLNHDLVGFNFHAGGAPVDVIAPLQPHFVRIDADLEHVSTGPGQPLHLDALLGQVQAARATGAEPLVILSYMPAWLGEPAAFGRDPTRVAPADLDAWQSVVHDVVTTLATAPDPAYWFEAWNEPDIPLFWQDTPAAWVDTVARSASAVAAVQRETGAPVRFGGPATAVPDPAYLVPFLTRFRDASLPLDFVSWHYYGNYPFFGPDGTEFEPTAPVQPIIGRPNPIASPTAFGPQVSFVRDLTNATLAGSGRATPQLVLDEWNLSAAGFDRRHDTADGAAFAAGALVEMQDARLDAAAFFMATDTRGVPGEHGAVTVDGTRKPVWSTFALWQQLGPTTVRVDAPSRDANALWAVATRDGPRVTILLTSFRPDGAHAARDIDVRLDGIGPLSDASASLRRIDAGHPDADTAVPVAIRGKTVHLTMPTPGVALLEITPGGRP